MPDTLSRLRDAYNLAYVKRVAAKGRGDRDAYYAAEREILAIETALRDLEQQIREDTCAKPCS